MCCSKVFQGILNEHGDEVCARATEILWQADKHFSDPTHKEFHILLYCKSGNHRSRGAPQRINRFTHTSRPTGSKFTHSCSQPAGQPDPPPTHPPTHPPIQTCGIHGRRHVPIVTLAADQCTIL